MSLLQITMLQMNRKDLEGARLGKVQARRRRLALHGQFPLVPPPCGLVGGGRTNAGPPANAHMIIAIIDSGHLQDI